MNDTISRISNVLTQVRQLKKKYDQLAAVTGEHFNVFSILRIKRKEVITHTPMLAELLNPHGSHRQGAAFLKLFLEICIKKQEYTNPETFRVRTEERTTDQKGQFDILLEKENEACIVIENKIDAEDRDSQLNRYYQDARKSFQHCQIKLIYLTLDGSSPDEKSLKAVNGQGRDLSMHDVIRISYREHIIEWLEKCMKLKEVERISPIREIVFQYRDLLNELTGQPTNTRYSMELKDILLRDENQELIPDLEEMLLEFNVHVQLEFWNELTRIMTEENRFQCHDNQGKEALDNIRNYYTASTNHLHFGRTFRLGISSDQTEIALRVELSDAGRIIYGFVLFCEDGKGVKSCKDNKFDTLAERLPNNDFKRTDGWIGYKRPARKIIFPPDYSRRNIEHLQDDRNRRESVQELVTEIANAVNQLKENLKTSLHGG